MMERLLWMGLGAVLGVGSIFAAGIAALTWDELDRKRRADAIERDPLPWTLTHSSASAFD